MKSCHSLITHSVASAISDDLISSVRQKLTMSAHLCWQSADGRLEIWPLEGVYGCFSSPEIWQHDIYFRIDKRIRKIEWISLWKHLLTSTDNGVSVSLQKRRSVEPFLLVVQCRVLPNHRNTKDRNIKCFYFFFSEGFLQCYVYIFLGSGFSESSLDQLPHQNAQEQWAA